MLKPAFLLLAAVAALPAAGCMTKQVRVQPSPAILQARARAQNERVHPAPRCASVTLTTAAPVIAGFGYERSEVSEAGADALDEAADWLICHPSNYATVTGEADPTGTAERQKQVAAERVQAVKAYLVKRGVAAGRILDYQPRAGGDILTITARGRGW